MKFRMKKLAGSALLGAAAVLAAPAAHADLITFESVTNVVSATLGANDTVYQGGDRFLDGDYSLTVAVSAFAASIGANGASGTIIDGANPYNCAVLSCPSDNPSHYFGGLNDGSVTVARQDNATFGLNSFSFAFIAPEEGLRDVAAGQVRLTAELADGSTVSLAHDFTGQGADGKYMTATLWLAPSFANLKMSSLRIDACVYDADSNCFNSLTTPAMNQAQFAIDNLDVTVSAVPEPATYGMLLAGLGMVGAVARRRRV